MCHFRHRVGIIACFAIALGFGCNLGSETSAVTTAQSTALVLFLASTDHNGNLGGLTGADAICQARANAAGLSGEFVAWLSDDSTDAIDRLTSNGPWKWPNGATAFANRTAIINSELAQAFDEFGNALSSNDSWTGTNADGTKNAANCSNWNSGVVGETGLEGDVDPGTGNWTEKGISTCDNLRKLICFQR